jgi:hypothetical protein
MAFIIIFLLVSCIIWSVLLIRFSSTFTKNFDSLFTVLEQVHGVKIWRPGSVKKVKRWYKPMKEMYAFKIPVGDDYVKFRVSGVTLLDLYGEFGPPSPGSDVPAVLLDNASLAVMIYKKQYYILRSSGKTWESPKEWPLYTAAKIGTVLNQYAKRPWIVGNCI